MKTLSIKRNLINVMALVSVLLLSSCGTYLSVYDNDGIYNRGTFEPKEEASVVVVSPEEFKEIDENYFAKKLESLERIQDNEIFTDVESYASESEFEDTNYAPAEPWGYENDNVVVNLNLWNDPFWGGFNNWGWGFNNWGWGFNDPWLYGSIGPYWNGPFWRNRFWGFNNWNWGWGFNNPWLWQGRFNNGIWGNRIWGNYWFQNNRYSRSLAYRNYRNRRGVVNSRYTNSVSRRGSATSNNRRYNSTSSRRSRAIEAIRRGGSVTRNGNTSSRNRTTIRRGTSSKRGQSTIRRSSSSRSNINRSRSSSSRSRGMSSSRGSSSRGSASRGGSRGSSRGGRRN